MAKPTPGITIRHARRCTTPERGAKCRCGPSFQAHIWSKRDKRRIRKTFPTLAAAKFGRPTPCRHSGADDDRADVDDAPAGVGAVARRRE